MERTFSNNNLSEHEIQILYECVYAAAHGPFFVCKSSAGDLYGEIHPLFGLTIDELQDVADHWPNVDMESEEVNLAINNSINNLLWYPHRASQETWAQYISTSPQELAQIFLKWRGEDIEDHFDAML